MYRAKNRMRTVNGLLKKVVCFAFWVIGNPNIARAHIAVNQHYPIEW